MSSSRQSKGLGRLYVKGLLGSQIRVLDGDSRILLSGVDELDVTIAQGLYLVHWSGMDGTDERIVSVMAGEETRVEPKEQPPSDSSAKRLWHVLAGERWIGETGRFDPALVAVLIDREKDLDVAQLRQDIRLVGTNDELLEPEPKLSNEADALVWPQVTAGRYRLRFRSISGEVLDQTIPVLGGRRTVIRLKAASASLLEHQEGGFSSVRSEGIDAAKTSIVTLLPSDRYEALEKHFRLADVLVRDLRLDAGSLSAAFVSEFEAKTIDPLLRTYAALVAVNCLTMGKSPALDEAAPDEPEQASKFRDRWRRIARGWLRDSKRAGMPPDATAALWQVERLKSPERPRQFKDAFSSITIPPMFDCAWRWAIARSTIHPQTLQGYASIRAATRSAAGTWPWLCWQPAAAKAVNPGHRPASAEELAELIATVAGKARFLTDSERASPTITLHGALSPEIANTAQQAVQAMQGIETPVADIASGFAVSLALPNTALVNRLRRTVQELDDFTFSGNSPTSFALQADTAHFSIDSERQAPALRRRIIDPEDSNRGRFGGKSEADGFSVSARFEPTANKNWMSIFITVRGDAPDGTPVQIFRHDSFKPKMREVTFENGNAEHNATAWGGFTVGVWIPGFEVELELDLAKLSNAPRIIRER